MTDDQAAVLHDTRLSREAMVIALRISMEDPSEPTEIPHRTLRLLLGRPWVDSAGVASCLNELESLGYLSWCHAGPGSYTVGPPGHVQRPRRRIPQDIRDAVFRRDGRRCDCGSTEDLTLDHITPFSHGGAHSTANLRVMCRSCNSRRGTGP